MDKQYQTGLDTHLKALEQAGCSTSRDGYQVKITTPDGQTFKSDDFPAAQGEEWGAIQHAMKAVGITAEDVLGK